MFESTIVSQATPHGFSAIAVVRLSGSRSFDLAIKISKTKQPLHHLKPRYLPIYIGSERKIDSGIFTPFKSPRSFTGEDIVEISCHGNPIIVSAIIEEFIGFGAKIAEPGEYTNRAFFNKKLDLTQAESIGLLIQARSLEAAEQQIKNLDGSISSLILNIKTSLLECLSGIEYELDISEDEFFNKNLQLKAISKFKKNIKTLERLTSTYFSGSIYSKGFRFVFLGKPNAGKSTLINTILNNQRSLTSPTPGTTRDVITTDIVMSGVPITIVDTAGVHKTKDRVELAGIAKTMEELSKADFVFSLFTTKLEPVDFIEDKNTCLIYNKNDIKPYSGTKPGVLSVSALSPDSVDLVVKKMKDVLKGVKTDGVVPLLTTVRQRDSLTQTTTSIKAAMAHLKTNNPELEIVAHEIQNALANLNLTAGKTTTKDILDGVFSSFCVGK